MGVGILCPPRGGGGYLTTSSSASAFARSLARSTSAKALSRASRCFALSFAAACHFTLPFSNLCKPPSFRCQRVFWLFPGLLCSSGFSLLGPLFGSHMPHYLFLLQPLRATKLLDLACVVFLDSEDVLGKGGRVGGRRGAEKFCALTSWHSRWPLAILLRPSQPPASHPPM